MVYVCSRVTTVEFVTFYSLFVSTVQNQGRKKHKIELHKDKSSTEIKDFRRVTHVVE